MAWAGVAVNGKEGGAEIHISLSGQRLRLCQGGSVVMDVPVSTASNGPGEVMNSGCTPRGWHVVRAKIGAGVPVNTVFVGRRPTGEVYTPALASNRGVTGWAAWTPCAATSTYTAPRTT